MSKVLRTQATEPFDPEKRCGWSENDLSNADYEPDLFYPMCACCGQPCDEDNPPIAEYIGAGEAEEAVCRWCVDAGRVDAQHTYDQWQARLIELAIADEAIRAVLGRRPKRWSDALPAEQQRMGREAREQVHREDYRLYQWP